MLSIHQRLCDNLLLAFVSSYEIKQATIIINPVVYMDYGVKFLYCSVLLFSVLLINSSSISV